MSEQRPRVVVELQPSREGCYVAACIEGAPDQLSRTLGDVLDSRDQAAAEATRWALGWLRTLREDQQAVSSNLRVDWNRLWTIGLLSAVFFVTGCARQPDPAFTRGAHTFLRHVMARWGERSPAFNTNAALLDATEMAERESLSTLQSEIDALPPGRSREERYLSVCARQALTEMERRLSLQFALRRAIEEHDSTTASLLEETSQATSLLKDTLFKLAAWERAFLGTSDVIDRMTAGRDTLFTITSSTPVSVILGHADTTVRAEIARLP